MTNCPHCGGDLPEPGPSWGRTVLTRYEPVLIALLLIVAIVRISGGSFTHPAPPPSQVPAPGYQLSGQR